MCQWCTEHGKGKKWFNAVENYVRKFDDMDEWAADWNGKYRTVQGQLWGPVSTEVDILKTRLSPRLEKLADDDWEVGFSQYHAGQIVTLDEAKGIVDVADNVEGFVKLACTCRKYKRGGKWISPENTWCLGVSAFAHMYHDHPERIWKEHKIETVSKEEAKEYLEKTSEMGLCHNASYMVSPSYMSKLCSCEYPVCVWMQWRFDWGINGILRKGHYVADIDWDKCTGCGECVRRCQFKALNIAVTYDKVILKQDLCYGCAQCADYCPEKAIKMIDRESHPVLKEAW